MTRSTPLAVAGNVNVDLVMGPVAPWPRPGTETIVAGGEVRYGGAAGNVALTWTALGRVFQIAANVGADHLGDWLRRGFAPQSRTWPSSGKATAISVGLTHPDSERTFFTICGHLADLSWPQVRKMIDWQLLSGGQLLVCGAFVTDGLAADYDSLFAHARGHGIRVALDTGWPPEGWTAATLGRVRGWLAECDCLLLNEAETCALGGARTVAEAMAALRPLMPEGAVVVVKRGPDGAIASDGAGRLHKAAAPAVDAVDTIGAGDVFNAAFLAARADGLPVGACLKAGVRTASAAISTSPRRYGIAGTPPIGGPSA